MCSIDLAKVVCTVIGRFRGLLYIEIESKGSPEYREACLAIVYKPDCSVDDRTYLDVGMSICDS